MWSKLSYEITPYKQDSTYNIYTTAVTHYLQNTGQETLDKNIFSVQNPTPNNQVWMYKTVANCSFQVINVIF